ncbi:MAG: hypothetical protein MZV64_52760 [Ignavibacteriales bacterium]|nr:hypothetical protein [Ignavibacteriales bacterium]
MAMSSGGDNVRHTEGVDLARHSPFPVIGMKRMAWSQAESSRNFDQNVAGYRASRSSDLAR